jgi:CubicO group peptidase (beta-lactamase class C family)
MTLMRSFPLISLLTLALLVPGSSATAASENDPISNLDSFITRALKEYQVPGAAIAAVEKRPTRFAQRIRGPRCD